MSNKFKNVMKIIAGIILLEAIIAIWFYKPAMLDTVNFNIQIQSDNLNVFQIFYSYDEHIKKTSFSDNNTCIVPLEKTGEIQTLSFTIPANTRKIRFDLGEYGSNFYISNFYFSTEKGMEEGNVEDLINVEAYKDITSYFMNNDNIIEGISVDGDPYLVWDVSQYDLLSLSKTNSQIPLLIFHLIATFILLGIGAFVFRFRGKIAEIPYELIVNRKMIWNLAKTDFKQRYSASYFGAIWAFVQPIITIAIYVFVFQVGFKAGNTSSGYPFLLYLVAGIIPWFFFAESWMNATNCLVEYNYLVKKVVFKISILPIVKVLSSLFVHLFFIVLAFLIFVVNGRMPGWTFLQLIYYLICVVCFSLALSYFTAAITPFFQDISQIINIITQLGMWTIPIMYDDAGMGSKLRLLFKLNPMYYVVTGYRDCFMHGVWVWDRVKLTIYFWSIVVILFVVGFRTFKKLRTHFADVL